MGLQHREIVLAQPTWAPQLCSGHTHTQLLLSYLSGGPCARSETLQVGKNLSTFLFDTLLWSKRFKTQGLGLNWYSLHAKSLSPSHGHPAPDGLKMRLWIYKISGPWRCFIAWANEREGERQHVRQRGKEGEKETWCVERQQRESQKTAFRGLGSLPKTAWLYFPHVPGNCRQLSIAAVWEHCLPDVLYSSMRHRDRKRRQGTQQHCLQCPASPCFNLGHTNPNLAFSIVIKWGCTITSPTSDPLAPTQFWHQEY